MVASPQVPRSIAQSELRWIRRGVSLSLIPTTIAYVELTLRPELLRLLLVLLFGATAATGDRRRKRASAVRPVSPSMPMAPFTSPTLLTFASKGRSKLWKHRHLRPGKELQATVGMADKRPRPQFTIPGACLSMHLGICIWRMLVAG